MADKEETGASEYFFDYDDFDYELGFVATSYLDNKKVKTQHFFKCWMEG